MLFDLHDTEAGKRDIAGGKGVGLHGLVEAGLPVPTGVVLSANAHRQFLEALAARLGSASALRAEREDARTELVQAHHSTPLPEHVSARLTELAARMSEQCPDGWAVRSSGVSEDGAERSMAGLHASVLGVPDAGLSGAVRECWASLWSKRALADRPAGAATPPAMAVVLQALVDAATSVVVFTRDPTGFADHMRVEAVRGAGEPLVSGKTTPQTTLLDRITLRARVPSRRSSSDPGTHIDPVLDSLSFRRLGDLAMRAERYFGCPLDIEAGFDRAGQVWFTQARPITAGLRASGRGEFR